MDVMDDLTGILIDTDSEELSPVLGGGCNPDLVAPDHWRGPPSVMNLGFPRDVTFLPFNWQGF